MEEQVPQSTSRERLFSTPAYQTRGIVIFYREERGAVTRLSLTFIWRVGHHY